MAVVAVALVTALVAWTRVNGGVPASRVTLAVLPFEYLGSDPERAYLAAGLTEETSASLAQIDLEHLIVKGRTLGYRGTAKTAAEIGRELSVDYLLESTLRAEGSRLRVTTTLIRARDQEHVWSRSYDRDPTSLLGLQQELSASIAEQIRLRLSRDHLHEVRQRQTQNADAYDAHLKGRDFHSRRTAATNALAVKEYERAVALDPNYALAWAGLAGAYTASTLNGDARPLEVWPRAQTPLRALSGVMRISARRSSPWGICAGYWTGTGGQPRRHADWRFASIPAMRRRIAPWATSFRKAASTPKPSQKCGARASSNHWSQSPTPCLHKWRSRLANTPPRRPRPASHSHRLAVLDWVHATGAGLRADGSARSGAGRAHGRGAVLG